MKKIILILTLTLGLNIYAETISEIQGHSHRSKYENKYVENVFGVVLKKFNGRYTSGFFMQSPIGDGDPITSDGIFVDNKDLDRIKIEEGDLVKVNGLVKEIQFGFRDDDALTITSIKGLEIEVIKKNVEVKPTTIYGAKIPFQVHDNSPIDVLNPELNAMDYFETFEGMLVKIIDPRVIGFKEKYGDIVVTPQRGKYATQKTKNGGLRYTYDNPQTQNIAISSNFIPITRGGVFKDKNFTPNTGDQFLGDIEGIMSFDFGTYKIMNTKPLPKLEDRETKKEPNKLGVDKEKLSIAGYNIENFSLSDDRYKVYDLAKQIKNDLKTPDIIALTELGDDNGSDIHKNLTNTSGDENIKALIREVKRETGIEYDYFMINPKHGRDGGKPSIHIRNAIMYRKDRLEIPYYNKGPQDVDTYVENGKLAFNPGRIGTKSEYFEGVRKSLVGHFRFKNKDVFVIVSHLSSKRGDVGEYSAVRPIVRKSEEIRHKQAQVINDFTKELHSKFKDAVIISLGDINDFEYSKTVSILKGDIMSNAIELLPENERYSYIFQGRSQILDNILVNKEYIGKTAIDIINVNVEFTHSQGAVSDHDPVYIELDVR